MNSGPLRSAALIVALALPVRHAFAQTPLPDQVYQLFVSSSTPPQYKRIVSQLIRMNTLAADRSARPAALSPAAASAAGFVSPRLAAGVYRQDGTGVQLPAGAVKEDVLITVEDAPAVERAAAYRASQEQKLTSFSRPVDFNPDGLIFVRPVEIALAYDRDAVRTAGVRLAELKVHFLENGTWKPLPSQADETRGVIRAQTTHFSVYQVMGPGGGIGVAAAEVALGFKAAYAFPNPVRGRNTVTLRVQPGLADSVEVRVYDLSGRKVHASSSFNNLGAFDDGNGLGPQFTYDHVWDVSGIGSGVYRYVVTAKKAGQTDIAKSGKVAVVK